MKGIGLVKAEWRPSPWAWTPIAWAAAVLWPPVSATLLFYPPADGALLQDWRLKAMAAAGVGIAAGLWLIRRERDATGTPHTRVGVVMRFFVLGAVFTAALIILSTLAMGISGAPFTSGFGAFFGALKTTLFIFGVAGSPFILLIGLSYALWAGLAVALIAFRPRPPSVRVHSDFWIERPAPTE